MTDDNYKPLTAAVMDKMGCSMPHCHHDHSELYFTQRCHKSAGLEARYVKADQTLVLSCEECEWTVAVIKVAP